MSETSARARRFALAFGSFARNGLIGARATGAACPDGVGDPGGAEAADTGGGVGTGRLAAVSGGATVDGLGANGAGGVPAAGRGPGPTDDGRAKGAGIPPGACVRGGSEGALGVAGVSIGPDVGRAAGGTDGMPPGIVWRSGTVTRGGIAGD